MVSVNVAAEAGIGWVGDRTVGIPGEQQPCGITVAGAWQATICTAGKVSPLKKHISQQW